MQSHLQSLPIFKNPFLMLPIEGGAFLMGSPKGDKDAFHWEKPQHSVTVSSFYLGQFPVTQALWRAVVMDIVGVAPSHPDNTPMLNPAPSRFQGDERPVEQVSWDDAQLFLQKLNALTQFTRPEGYFYCLPTEAEWEYAARGGPYHADGYRYAGSDRLKDVGWFVENSGGETQPVGLKYPNQLGLYDMSGNVYEWCVDCYGDSAYYEHCKNQGVVKDPLGPDKGSFRVVRGGSWDGGAGYCRAACRDDGGPDDRDDLVGFRLALALQSVGRSLPTFL